MGRKPKAVRPGGFTRIGRAPNDSLVLVRVAQIRGRDRRRPPVLGIGDRQAEDPALLDLGLVPPGPAKLGYRLSELLPLPLPEKQALLEMNDPVARLARLATAIPPGTPA